MPSTASQSTASPPRAHGRVTHPHHWVIEPPEGARSLGRCRQCGLERSFANSSEATRWVTGGEADADVARLQRDLARDTERARLADEAA